MKNFIKILLITISICTVGTVFAATASWTFDVSGNYTFDTDVQVTGGTANLVLANRVSPSVVGSDTLTLSSVGGQDMLNDSTLFVADSTSGVTIYDVSDRTNPTVIASSGVGTSDGVFVSPDGNEFYVNEGGRGSAIKVYDISTLATPTNVGSYTPGGVAYSGAVASDGNTAFFGIGSGGSEILALDVSTPATPAFLGSYIINTPDTMVLSADNNTLYTTDGGTGIEILDVSDPTNIVSLGSGGVAEGIRSIVLSSDENTLFAASLSDGFFVYDVSNPASITLLDSDDTYTDYYGIDIASDDDTVFLVSSASGLVSFDVSDTSNIARVNTFGITGTVRNINITSDDETAFVTNLEDSLFGIDLYDLAYSSTSPSITPTTGEAFTTTITAFTETLGGSNAGTVTYQVSPDDGTTWYYWNTTVWATTTATDGSETSSASDVNTNIATLDTDGGTFLFRAYLNSNGSQIVALDTIAITITDAVTSTSSRQSGSRKYSPSQVAELFAQARGDVSTDNTSETISCMITYTRLLKQGVRGDDVRQVQVCMNSLGYHVGPEDGIYGPLTYAGITAYQGAQGLRYIDGIVGPETSTSLNSL